MENYGLTHESTEFFEGTNLQHDVEYERKETFLKISHSLLSISMVHFTPMHKMVRFTPMHKTLLNAAFRFPRTL